VVRLARCGLLADARTVALILLIVVCIAVPLLVICELGDRAERRRPHESATRRPPVDLAPHSSAIAPSAAARTSRRR
jgi:hypothetical protein